MRDSCYVGCRAANLGLIVIFMVFKASMVGQGLQILNQIDLFLAGQPQALIYNVPQATFAATSS
jgi:hypothetical protein